MKKKPRGWIPVEPTFDAFVKEFKGELVRELVDVKKRETNADYLFRNDSVIAELKCLEKDTFDAEYDRKLNTLVDSWVKRRLLWYVGKPKLELRKLDPICQQEWLRLVEPHLQRHVVTQANLQIKMSKQQLKHPNAKGLLLIAIDGNYSLQPEDLITHFGRILTKTKKDGSLLYSSIHWVVFFTVNVGVRLKNMPEDALVWLPAYRYRDDTTTSTFIEKLREGWIGFHKTLTGSNGPTLQVEAETLSNAVLVRPLEVNEFYKDSLGGRYKCLAVTHNQVTWLRFETLPDGRRLNVEITQELKYAGNYTRLRDVDECQRLQARYLKFMKIKSSQEPPLT